MRIATTSFLRFIVLAVSCCLAVSMAGCGSPAEEPEEPLPTEIEVRVEGPSFRPAMEFTAAATVTIDYGDGTAPAVTAIDAPASGTAAFHEFDNHAFADAVVSHEVTIVVQPWSALKVLNLGYFAMDGGNDTGTNGLDSIQTYPSGTALPGEDNETWIRRYVGTVSAVRGLSAAVNLYGICCEYQALEEIDLSRCAELRTLEAYAADIKRTSFSGCTNLVRCSVEGTGARYSWRVVNGQRVEDASLDLADCVALRDIRGSADDHEILKLHPGALGTLWHLCKWGNPRFTQVKIGNEAPGKLPTTRFSALRQLWVGGSPMLGELIIDNGAIESVWGNACGITRVQAVNQQQLRELQLHENPITSLEISGCPNIYLIYFNDSTLSAAQTEGLVDYVCSSTNLRILELNNCRLTQAQVDRILTAFNALPVPSNINEWDSFRLDLSGGNNAAPSEDGATERDELRAKVIPVNDGSVKQWTVLVN